MNDASKASSTGSPETRQWPHDEPNGWNLDAAKFLALVQANPMLWIELGRAKYLEMRIDTRDGGFNLYDRDRKPLNPDEVVAAAEKARANYGDQGITTPAQASIDRGATFVIPDGHEAVRDNEGRATGETRPVAQGSPERGEPDVEPATNPAPKINYFRPADAQGAGNCGEPVAWVPHDYHLWLTPHGQPASAAMMWKEKSKTEAYQTPLYASPPAQLHAGEIRAAMEKCAEVADLWAKSENDSSDNEWIKGSRYGREQAGAQIASAIRRMASALSSTHQNPQAKEK